MRGRDAYAATILKVNGTGEFITYDVEYEEEAFGLKQKKFNVTPDKLSRRGRKPLANLSEEDKVNLESGWDEKW